MEKKDIENYTKVKYYIALSIMNIFNNTYNFTKEYIKENIIEPFIQNGGDIREVKQYKNILDLYDDIAAKDIYIQPTMLITIDSIEKEIAWITRMSHYNFE